jgi:hypothetical protein
LFVHLRVHAAAICEGWICRSPSCLGLNPHQVPLLEWILHLMGAGTCLSHLYVLSAISPYVHCCWADTHCRPHSARCRRSACIDHAILLCSSNTTRAELSPLISFQYSCSRLLVRCHTTPRRGLESASGCALAPSIYPSCIIVYCCSATGNTLFPMVFSTTSRIWKDWGHANGSQRSSNIGGALSHYTISHLFGR